MPRKLQNRKRSSSNTRYSEEVTVVDIYDIFDDTDCTQIKKVKDYVLHLDKGFKKLYKEKPKAIERFKYLNKEINFHQSKFNDKKLQTMNMKDFNAFIAKNNEILLKLKLERNTISNDLAVMSREEKEMKVLHKQYKDILDSCILKEKLKKEKQKKEKKKLLEEKKKIENKIKGKSVKLLLQRRKNKLKLKALNEKLKKLN